MYSQKKLIVSHAPFIHDGGRVPTRNYHIMLAALPAAVFGMIQYGAPALAVICLAVSSAIFWELLMNLATRRSKTIGDGQAALLGLLLAMMLPATAPWWLVVIGTFVALIIGKHIFGGIGGNPFHPVLIAMAILSLSWGSRLDFDSALVNYDFNFAVIYPLGVLKSFGASSVSAFTPVDLFMGKQVGGIGATFGLGILLGGIYLIIRGFIRWEISVSFLAGIFLTALIFNLTDSSRFAGPLFHLFTGYTMIGAFFLATDDSSSPVHFLPMLLYGAIGGVMTVLIRNIGAYADGVIYAILIINILNPLLDKIRPKAIGKVE
jgi:electron transport complex protein RnfD